MIDRVSKGSRISDEKNKLEAPSLVDFKMDSDSEEDEASDTTNNEISLKFPLKNLNGRNNAGTNPFPHCFALSSPMLSP